MDCGFETIGNATVICHDKKPILATDPWMGGGGAYFGSWALPYEVPEKQLNAIKDCEYIWLSHGHPDHLHLSSLEFLKDKKILLPDHVGKRIYDDLKALEFDVHTLKDKVWNQLSDRIRVLCISDYNQDAVLLIEIADSLVVNTNDALEKGWGRFIRREVKKYQRSFLLCYSGFGDVDMINIFDEDGERVTPAAARRFPCGAKSSCRAESFGVTFYAPFSSMHEYQRADSVWANAYVAHIEDLPEGFDSSRCKLLPAFIQYDCLKDDMREINPRKNEITVLRPEDIGDSWDDELEKPDVDKLNAYFKSIEHLHTFLDYIRFRVGGKEHVIEFSARNFQRGITFETPRGSLTKSVDMQIFDDLLIGNFMKTTLHGKWGKNNLHPDFTPYVGKFADNGLAKTAEELGRYFEAYRKRAPLDYLRSQVERKAVSMFRGLVTKDSTMYHMGLSTYYKFKTIFG